MDDSIEAEHLKNDIFIHVNNEKNITLKGQKNLLIKNHTENERCSRRGKVGYKDVNEKDLKQGICS
jgi:hypothetical protein